MMRRQLDERQCAKIEVVLVRATNRPAGAVDDEDDDADPEVLWPPGFAGTFSVL